MRKKLPLLLVAAFFAAQTQAIHFITTNTFSVAEGEQLAGEYWIQAVDVKINGQVDDDLFVATQNRMALDGLCAQNVWGLGKTIELSGHTKRNVRLMGTTILMDGQADGNLMALGNTIKLGANTTIGGNAMLVGGSVILEGTIKGDASIIARGGTVTISGSINGNVEVDASEIILLPDTRIGGNLSYTSAKELVPAQGIVSGELKRVSLQPLPLFSVERLYARLLGFMAAMLVGMAFISLFPMSTAMASQLARTSPFKCFGTGVACFLLLPMFGLMSITSFVGLPLGLMLFGGWGFLAYTGHIVMGLVVGTLILRKNATSIGQVVLAMGLGLAIIYVATAIPSIISLAIWLAAVCIGMGALLLGLAQKRRLIIKIPEELKHLEELKKQNIANQEEEQ